MKYILIIILLLSFSCKNENPKENSLPTKISEPLVKNINSPVNDNSSLPRLYSNGKELFMSWVRKNDSINTLKYSKFNGDTWTSPSKIISGSDWFVNWADFPAIAENNGNVLTNVLQKSADGTYTYDIRLQLFSKNKNTWKNNLNIYIKIFFKVFKIYTKITSKLLSCVLSNFIII